MHGMQNHKACKTTSPSTEKCTPRANTDNLYEVIQKTAYLTHRIIITQTILMLFIAINRLSET